MRTTLALLIGIHGIIHLFGFLKAFGITEFSAIQQPISKTSGLFWLLTCLLFTVAFVLFLIQSDYWWTLGFLALILSQVLIFSYWSDAKFGTAANLVLLFTTIVGYSSFSFKHQLKDERRALFQNATFINTGNLTTDEIAHLPSVVQKWLTQSGAIGKPKVSNVYLTQELQLKLKPEQTEWNNGTAEQYFTTSPPAFNWNIETQMNSFLNVTGRDQFINGKGEMLIKLLSLVPVADAKNDEKINEAALQRYLAEMVWFPSNAISKHIHWEEIDNTSAKATMEYNGTKGSGVFYFDTNGQFEKFVTMRYKDVNDTAPTKWTVTASKTKERNGIKIPTECEAHWSLHSKQWTWLKLKIKHIEYNVEEMPHQ